MTPKRKAKVDDEELARQVAREVGAAVSKIERICDRLYSSEDGHNGDIPGIMSRLDKVNGNITDLKKCDNQHEIMLALIEERQKYVFPRMLKDMPKWAQALVALSILGAITNLGLALDSLVGLFV